MTHPSGPVKELLIELSFHPRLLPSRKEFSRLIRGKSFVFHNFPMFFHWNFTKFHFYGLAILPRRHASTPKRLVVYTFPTSYFESYQTEPASSPDSPSVSLSFVRVFANIRAHLIDGLYTARFFSPNPGALVNVSFHHPRQRSQCVFGFVDPVFP